MPRLCDGPLGLCARNRASFGSGSVDLAATMCRARLTSSSLAPARKDSRCHELFRHTFHESHAGKIGTPLFRVEPGLKSRELRSSNRRIAQGTVGAVPTMGEMRFRGCRWIVAAASIVATRATLIGALLLCVAAGGSLAVQAQPAAGATVGDQIAAFAASEAGVPYCDGGGGINGPPTAASTSQGAARGSRASTA